LLRQVSSGRVNAQREAKTARRLSILIADDEPDTVATLSAILSDEGHVVHHVYRGDDVARALKRYKPEVCILDIEMPGRNGYELAKEISGAAGRPVLIAISGKYVQESERHLALAMGFDRFFAKPADPRKLVALIEEIGGREATGHVEARRQRPLRVLIADDDHDTVVTTAALLRDEGYEVMEAHNGKDAMVAIADFDPDVVIADINMPGVSGWQLGRAVRRVSGYGRPLLIAISGHYKAATDRILTDMSGFNHFLPKPFDMKDLLALIERRKQE
jgi:DNA-binding response OmpR family regulator